MTPVRFETKRTGRMAIFCQPGAMGVAALGLLLIVCGCQTRECIEPRDEHEALLRVNDNLTRIDQPVQYQAFASFRFRDGEGHDRRFIGQEAKLTFYQPRNLLFDIRSLAGVIAQFGANDERYWIWIEPEVRKLWWGRWDALVHGTPRKLPLPPDDLLDVLMLRPLPEALTGGVKVMLRKVEQDYRLLYLRSGQDGQALGWREIRLDPCEPYQPLEIVDRTPGGDVQMHAYLTDYQPIGRDGPLTPRHYVVYWPMSHAEMRMDVTKATLRPELRDVASDLFEFPAGWRGQIEDMDQGAAQPTAPQEDVN